MLHWSQWRRWHQAWARYYHYRRRQGHAPPAPQQRKTTQPPTLIDVLWHRLESLLPPTPRTGRPFAHDRRLVLEAIVYGMQSDCAWRALPAEISAMANCVRAVLPVADKGYLGDDLGRVGTTPFTRITTTVVLSPANLGSHNPYGGRSVPKYQLYAGAGSLGALEQVAQEATH